MPTFNSIKELTCVLQQGGKLLNDMFIKCKTFFAVCDAGETFDLDKNF